MSFRLLFMLAYLLWSLPLIASALTTEEILLLKQNGVSEKTIQMMLQSEIEAQRDKAAGTPMGIETIVRPDGRPAIVYSTGSGNRRGKQDEEQKKVERAWRMLRHIIVDTRTPQARE